MKINLCSKCQSTLTQHHECHEKNSPKKKMHIDYQCHFVEKGARCILPGKVSSSRYHLTSWFCKEHWKHMQFSKK